LGDAARQGLPVPPGVALSGDLVEVIASGDEKAIEKLAKAITALPPPFAVRSSAVDEDGASASFAGQHLTLLNVHSAADVAGAIRSLPNGGTFEDPVPLQQINQLCLDDTQLAALSQLALQCEQVYGPRRDIEWAFQDGKLYLLQCRAITTGKARGETPVQPPPR